MNKMIENLINGNLTDARAQAKRYSISYIAAFMRSEYGWSCKKAVAGARYLKTGKGFQAYCDEE